MAIVVTQCSEHHKTVLLTLHANELKSESQRAPEHISHL